MPDRPDIPDSLRAKFNPPEPPPLETARSFLGTYWSDEGIPEAVRESLKRTIAITPRSVIRGLRALETLLASPNEPGVLLDLVLWDANHPLEDPTDEGAREWLLEAAALVREVLDEAS